MFAEINRKAPPELPFVPITIGECAAQGRVERPNGFELHQFIWVTKGEGVFTVNGKSELRTKGQGFFSRKGIPHTYQSTGGDFSTMWLTFLNGESLLQYYRVKDFFFFDTPEFLNASTTHLMELCQDTFSQAIRSAHGFAWATALLDAIFQKLLTLQDRLFQFLEHNYDKPLALEEIAAHMGMDKYALCRAYSKASGKTVMQALKKVRIQKAKSLLCYSVYSVEQVGAMCGFESASYFIKIFREETGRTPRQYRLKNKGTGVGSTQ